jgi:tetratricopeptide (TPR) repeat protein
MSTFQLLLLIVAGGVFYLFFKQLFSGNHPKRGVDFEAKVADEQIGGINRPDKIFSTPKVQPTRMEQLLAMTDEAVEKEDYEEAKKALGSALIIDKNNTEVLQKMGYVCMQIEDENDDMAHVSLANVLHKLDDEAGAEKHHERAIMLDEEYAPHHFNYANTLYDLGRTKEALIGYKRAYELDDSLEEAEKMIKKLSE